MSESTDGLERRTVLRAAVAGATAVTGLGAVGTASADHYYEGQCVRITLDVQSFENACPNDTYGPVFESGQEGTVWRTCQTDGGDEMILFEPDNYEQDRGWVRDEYVESC